MRSKSLEDLKAELIQVAANGYREVVLVGINLSAYGLDEDLILQMLWNVLVPLTESTV